MRVLRFCWIVVALAFQPALARDWQPAGGWTIIENDKACSMASSFEGMGDPVVILQLQIGGDLVFSVSNKNWSVVPKRSYPLELIFDDQSARVSAVGYAAEGDAKGFLLKMGGDWAAVFARSSGVGVKKDDTPIANFSLSGSGAAITVMRQCVAHLQKAEATAEREAEAARWRNRPIDPFANDPAADAGPKPRGSSGTWVTDADYPSRAQREERSGTTGYRLEVASDGRVTGCTVTSSSGSADLDAETCRLLPRRARFAGGAGIYEDKINWRLPQ